MTSLNQMSDLRSYEMRFTNIIKPIYTSNIIIGMKLHFMLSQRRKTYIQINSN